MIANVNAYDTTALFYDPGNFGERVNLNAQPVGPAAVSPDHGVMPDYARG